MLATEAMRVLRLLPSRCLLKRASFNHACDTHILKKMFLVSWIFFIYCSIVVLDNKVAFFVQILWHCMAFLCRCAFRFYDTFSRTFILIFLKLCTSIDRSTAIFKSTSIRVSSTFFTEFWKKNAIYGMNISFSQAGFLGCYFFPSKILSQPELPFCLLLKLLIWYYREIKGQHQGIQETFF